MRLAPQALIAFEFETVCYISIYFFILLNKPFGSITTHLGFDFHWKKSTCTVFLQYKGHHEVCKSLTLSSKQNKNHTFGSQ